MSPIKDFRVLLDDERPFYSEGDSVEGRVTFTLTKETKVKSVFVKAKGDAHVHWTEGSGDDSDSYSADRRYFKLKQYLVEDNSNGTKIPPGVHQFKFSFVIPNGDFPSSIHMSNGKIIYVIHAKISRSMHLPSTVEQEIRFVSKSIPQQSQVICPLSGSVEKKTGVFSKGTIQMSATVDRNVCSPGDTLSIVANISNSSSKKMIPKFKLVRKTVYKSVSSSDINHLTMCKGVGDTVASNSQQTASSQLQVPGDAVCTVHNCEILSVEYILKVYLDISFASDPEVAFPIFVAPRCFAPPQFVGFAGPYPVGVGGPYQAGTAGPGPYASGSGGPGPYPMEAYPAGTLGPYLAGASGPYPAGSAGPYPAVPAGGPSYSDFPPPALYQGPAGSVPYPAPDPSQHKNVPSSYNNPWPQ